MFNWNEILAAIAAGGLTALVMVGPFVWLIRVNTTAFELFRDDKARAVANLQRTPEAALLRAARWGWVGAKLAQRFLRHKTRKEPFRSDLNRVGFVMAAKMVVIAVALALTIPHMRPQSAQFGQSIREALQTAPVTPVQGMALRPRPRPPTLGG